MFQLSNGVTPTGTKSNGDIHGLPPTALDSTPRPRWIPRITTPTNEFYFYIRDITSPLCYNEGIKNKERPLGEFKWAWYRKSRGE